MTLAKIVTGLFLLSLSALPASAAQEQAVFSFSPTATLDYTSLLKRSDVQNELNLTVQQKNDLAELLKSPTAFRLAVTSETPLSREEMRKKMEEQIAAQLEERDAKFRGALRPEQFKRLEELAYQWRGPLAMAEARIAKKLKLSPEHRSAMEKINGEYQAEKMKVMAALSERKETTSPDGSQRAVAVRINASELEKPLSPAYKALSAAKAAAEQKIMALLSDEEKAAWKAAQGAPFVFRTDLPGNRF